MCGEDSAGKVASGERGGAPGKIAMRSLDGAAGSDEARLVPVFPGDASAGRYIG